MLTETAYSAGCEYLAEQFQEAGYAVVFPRPGRGERGVMVVSRLALEAKAVPGVSLRHRGIAATVQTDAGPLDVLGVYVPSRDATSAKIERKHQFLQELTAGLPGGRTGQTLVIGDFNILEPGHVPAYKTFKSWEYEFYAGLDQAGYADAFRLLWPDAAQYSWVGRTGDGYRYDHAHVSGPIAARVEACTYVHEPRTAEERLTDHSALTVRLALTATQPLTVKDPTSSAGCLLTLT